MDTQCCFINGATYVIGAKIGTTLSGARSHAARACKPAAGTKAVRFSNKFLNVATTHPEIKRAAPRSIIGVVFTVGGPVATKPQAISLHNYHVSDTRLSSIVARNSTHEPEL
jgi:hypothetical protein